MKALTLWEPWASAIARGYKKIETRSWGTAYRGKLAIHASKHIEPKVYNWDGLAPGCVVCTATLVDCIRMSEIWIDTLDYEEIGWGDFRPGRYAWILGDVKHINPPIPAKGHQGLWEWKA